MQNTMGVATRLAEGDLFSVRVLLGLGFTSDHVVVVF